MARPKGKRVGRPGVTTDFYILSYLYFSFPKTFTPIDLPSIPTIPMHSRTQSFCFGQIQIQEAMTETTVLEKLG